MQNAKCKMQNVGSLRSKIIRFYSDKKINLYPPNLRAKHRGLFLLSALLLFYKIFLTQVQSDRYMHGQVRPQFCILHFAFCIYLSLP